MNSIGVSDASQWEDVVGRLRSRYGDGISVVLVGSVARGRSTEESDIDFLVVGEDHPKTTCDLPRYHVQVSNEADFKRNLALGEDFEGWSVRFGLPLYDGGPWARILRSDEATVWPRWQAKIPHAARRLFMASALLRMGDLDAATEETIYALCHVARALLLKAGVFPLSRPELAEQVKALGYSRLAQLHGELRRPNGAPLSRIRLAQRYSKKLLLHLDRPVYAKCSREYRERNRAKSHRHR
jgi:predicted nucleotidyltransferase